MNQSSVNWKRPSAAATPRAIPSDPQKRRAGRPASRRGSRRRGRRPGRARRRCGALRRSSAARRRGSRSWPCRLRAWSSRSARAAMAGLPPFEPAAVFVLERRGVFLAVGFAFAGRFLDAEARRRLAGDEVRGGVVGGRHVEQRGDAEEDRGGDHQAEELAAHLRGARRGGFEEVDQRRDQEQEGGRLQAAGEGDRGAVVVHRAQALGFAAAADRGDRDHRADQQRDGEQRRQADRPSPSAPPRPASPRLPTLSPARGSRTGAGRPRSPRRSSAGRPRGCRSARRCRRG